MGSPKTDGNAVDISAANSPSEQKSPISQFLNDLSPIKSPTASVSTQRLSEPSFPTIPSVFTSPHHLDMEQKPSFLQREEIGGSSSNAPGQCFSPLNSTLRPCIQKPLQSCGPSEGVGEYQAGPMVLDGARHGETCAQSADDVGARMLPHLAQKHLVSGSLSLVEVSDDQSLDERLDKILEFSSENFWDHVESDEFREHQVGQDASQHQQGLQRHLQVEASSDRKSDAAFNYHTSSRPEIEVPSLIESKRISKGLQAIYSGQAMTSQASFLGSKSVISTENGPGRSNNLLEDINNGPLSSTAMEAGDHIASDHQNSESPQWDSQKVSSFNQLTLPSDGKIPGQQFANRVNEELSQCQDSLKGKRKRETYTDESESCKLCNCKRSKCLKLYCECFAAGIYCVDSCACENCFNKPDYEDTVQDVRQEIESRNPLAFAPTIVGKANDSPNIAGDANSMTPSSARHKRGCKCKRSKCLKKYCECYRAKVGCSDGCHCEDCDNSFGKKSESTFQRAEKWKNPSHGKLNTVEVEMMSDSTEVQTADQFLPTWRQLVDMNHLNPLASLNMVVDSPNVSQAESQKGSGLQWCSSALSPTQACASKMSELDSTINELREIMGDASPDILMQDSNHTNTVKSGSPNQKRVSPPQPHRLGSNSPPGWPHGRKLVLPAEPPYPPPTTHCNSDDRMNQTENDHQDRSKNQ